MWSRAHVKPLESSLHPYITLISRSVQILQSQLRLCLKWVFLSGFPTKILYVIRISNIHTTHPVHLVFPDGIISIIFGEKHILEAPRLTVFSSLVTSSISSPYIILGTPFWNNLNLCSFLRAGFTNLWHGCPKWHAKRFSWQAAFTAVPIISPTNLVVLWITYMRRNRDCIWLGYRYYQTMLRVNTFYTNQKRWDIIGCQNRLPKMLSTILFFLSL
jgi:hypothetical protein